MSDGKRDMTWLNRDIKEICDELETTPEKLGIDLEFNKGLYKKVGLVTNSHSKYFEFEVDLICNQCGNHVDGLIRLDRHDLKIEDTEGFLIIDEPVCNACIKW